MSIQDLDQVPEIDAAQPADVVVEGAIAAQPETPAAEPTALEIVQDTLSESPKFERDESGKFVTKKPAEPEAAKVDAEGKPVVKPKDDDPLKMPDGLTAPAQERFQGMASKIKELDGEVSSYKETLGTLTRTLEDHGVDDKVFNDLLTYSKVVTSGDTRQWGEMLRNQVRNFELATGQPFNSIDPLAAYPDIQNALQRGELTEAYARQLADAREAQSRIGQAQQQFTQAQQTEQQAAKTLETTLSQVSGLVSQWANSDVSWGMKQTKVAAFAEKIAGNPQIPPTAYAPMIQEFYSTLQTQTPAPRPTNVQPLRAAASSAGPVVATTFEEAVRNSIFG